MDTPRQIIDALGGYREVAASLTDQGEPLTPVRVHNWTRRGIPGEFWHELVAIAETKQVQGITFDALRTARVPAAPKRQTF